jgi:hypothetical protein
MDELRKLFPKGIAKFGQPEFSTDEITRIRMMVPLCASCHGKQHSKSKEKQYMNFFDDLIMTKHNGKCYYTKEEFKNIK